jgi:DNA replication ATP-dependent helicase Dna2
MVELVKIFSRYYELSDIGIITPFRAQIAKIRQVLEKQGFDPDTLTVDTVERYQGGAREVILISLCTNSEAQVATLTSLSEEGIDRKLNVALTRAREHLVVLGNESLLRGQKAYHQLLDFLQSR